MQERKIRTELESYFPLLHFPLRWFVWRSVIWKMKLTVRSFFEQVFEIGVGMPPKPLILAVKTAHRNWGDHLAASQFAIE